MVGDLEVAGPAALRRGRSQTRSTSRFLRRVRAGGCGLPDVRNRFRFNVFGLPPTGPRDRAAARPGITRSWLSLRSNSTPRRESARNAARCWAGMGSWRNCRDRLCAGLCVAASSDFCGGRRASAGTADAVHVEEPRGVASVAIGHGQCGGVSQPSDFGHEPADSAVLCGDRLARCRVGVRDRRA